MGHVSPPLAELTAQAQTMTAEGDLAGARAVLAGVLDPAETDPHRASPDLALAAALHARILIALGDAHAARTWAGFAHAAQERLHGPHDERTIAAAATHAAVLQRVGNHGRAAQLYHDLVGELTALEGPLSPRVLAAEADLATAEHAAGHCTAARARLTDAWTRYREAYGDASAPGIKMLARLGAMERECARTPEGNDHLALAQELCARHLPADHPLAQQVARLAGAPPTGRHVCGRVHRSTGPTATEPAATRSAAGPATTGPAWQQAPIPEADGPIAGPATTIPTWQQAPAAETGNPIAGPATTSPTWQQPIPSAEGGGLMWRPDPRPADTDPATDPADGPTADPANGPAAHLTEDGPATIPGVYPVLPDQPAPGDPTGRHARPAAPLPLDSPLPEGPSPEAPAPAGWPEPQESTRPGTPPAEWPGHGYVAQALAAAHDQAAPPQAAPPQAAPPQLVHSAAPPPGPYPPDSFPPAPTSPGAYPPGPRLPVDRASAKVSDRLPVPVERPEERSTRQPFILATVLVAGVAAAAAIVAVTLPRGDPAGSSAAAPTAAPTSVQSPAASQGAAVPATPVPSVTVDPIAPVDVRLRDNRDSVSLTWRYPEGSEGPVLISGGRTGQEQRAFQQLPAGTTEYVVYGLNEQNDYCFSVAVVYTVDKVAASQPVCTARK